MKRAIFLLTCCAFQTVFANLKQDLDKLREKKTNEINAIIHQFGLDVETAIADARRRGLNEDVEECWEGFRRLARYYALAETRRLLKDCYITPFELSIYEAFTYAEECYEENIKSLVIKETEGRAIAKECVQKHLNMFIGPMKGKRKPIAL